jgi:hypothetical protein
MLAVLAVPAAHAGEAARNCKTYWAQGNPNSGWGFTVCVKLVHDPNAHTWWSTGSVSSTTPGIKLYLDSLSIYSQTSGVTRTINTATRYGTGSDFVTAITFKYACSGRHNFQGAAVGHAIWPNGVRSQGGLAETSPIPYSGTC